MKYDLLSSFLAENADTADLTSMTPIQLLAAYDGISAYGDRADAIEAQLQRKLSAKIRNAIGLKGGKIYFQKNDYQDVYALEVVIDTREEYDKPFKEAEDALIELLKNEFGRKVKTFTFLEVAERPRFYRTVMQILK